MRADGANEGEYTNVLSFTTRKQTGQVPKGHFSLVSSLQWHVPKLLWLLCSKPPAVLRQAADRRQASHTQLEGTLKMPNNPSPISHVSPLQNSFSKAKRGKFPFCSFSGMSCYTYLF